MVGFLVLRIQGRYKRSLRKCDLGETLIFKVSFTSTEILNILILN